MHDIKTNHAVVGPGLQAGMYLIDVRVGTDPDNLGPWSLPLRATVHAEETDYVWTLRRAEHRLSMMLDRDVDGVVTVTDPQGSPPAHPGDDAAWFPTFCYEGVTPLFNEVEAYYRDPLGYYLDTIRALRDRGYVFHSWHDVIDGQAAPGVDGVIVQLDVDGGLRSVEPVIEGLLELGVRATLMIHARALPWYIYELEDQALRAYQGAQAAGWAIGYHSNAVGQAQEALDRTDYGQEVMALADRVFLNDVTDLRAAALDVRTYTAHGGNTLNHRQSAPDAANVVCVDRANIEIWSPVRTMFSDGGFVARPGPFSTTIAALGPGLHFVRNHPFKYGNYQLADPDARPARHGIGSTAEARQTAWLAQRRDRRMGVRFSRGTEHKPVSRVFPSWTTVQNRVDRHRAERRPTFLREYPDPTGDPRVFWWRMLDAYVPAGSTVVNVGALPPNMRGQHRDFLGHTREVVEMDIDPDRVPDVLASAAEPPAPLRHRFDVALLFGLPYFDEPERAIAGCREMVVDDGIGLFGFPDDTHPRRGAFWNPTTRPLWRRGAPPLKEIGLTGHLWSFDDRSVRELLEEWTEVEVENFSHYWFCVARA